MILLNIVLTAFQVQFHCSQTVFVILLASVSIVVRRKFAENFDELLYKYYKADLGGKLHHHLSLVRSSLNFFFC